MKRQLPCWVAMPVLSAKGGASIAPAVAAMPVNSRLEDDGFRQELNPSAQRFPDPGPSRIIRCVGAAEDVDGIARLERSSGERCVEVEREVGDRDGTDGPEHPLPNAFHRCHHEIMAGF